MIGTTVGNYRIRERLGDGGMGAVYRAVDEMLDREVAIKVLKPELARNAALIERFRMEAIALARLNHPRIATLHGLERHGASFLMVMEYVRGETLEAIVQRSGRLAWQRAAELCAATLDALDHAHDKGVVHRDIKPANIMLTANGAVKVMDFGIARLIGKNRQTQVGHAVGTPMYMAPEQLRGEEVDGRTDLYATGAVLFELVTGRMAFEADSDYALMMMQLNDPPPAASTLVPGVPTAVDDIVQRAMAKRREDRFPNANAFREMLEQLVRSHGTAARRQVPAETRLASSPPPPATRLAGSHAAIPETRLEAAGAAPATSHAPPTSSTVTTQARNRMSAWSRDWRAYATAGALFASAGFVARLTRSDASQVASDGTVTADTTHRVAPAPVAKDTTREPVPGPPREDASQLLINPPSTVAAGGGGGLVAPNPPDVAPKPPKSDGSAPRPTRPSEDKPVERSAPPKETTVASEPSKPVNEEAEGDADASMAIRGALQVAASALSGRNSDATALLSGGVRDQWVALMKEGRISLAVAGTPDIQRRGTRASAEFDASVNVRSPFGANRRQSARFAAELERGGGGWRVVSLRPLGALDLK